MSGEDGALVVEIVPADEVGCTVGQPPRPASGTYDYGICTGANETPPAVGAHVAVTGPHVLDTAHGWMEIHPVWDIADANTVTATTTAPSPSDGAVIAPPATTAPTPDCTPGYDPCIPPGPDVDCAGGGGNGPRYVHGPVKVTGSDPYRLDGNHDGVACE